LNLPEEAKIKLVESLGEYEFRISEGADSLIQHEAFLAQLAVYGGKTLK
ncbi:replication factor C small subunit, partial [Candidatus Bathyarchaeota archaeon]